MSKVKTTLLILLSGAVAFYFLAQAVDRQPNVPSVVVALRLSQEFGPDWEDRYGRGVEQESASSIWRGAFQQRLPSDLQARSRTAQVQRDGKEAERSENSKGRARSGPILGCEQFYGSNFSWPKHLETIAVVGNGPLKEESRDEINGMDLVIRFNKLQSYRCGEKFDVWASRHSDAVTTRYWGIGQMLNITGCPFNKLLELTENIWLLNGGDAPFDHFMKSYPYIKIARGSSLPGNLKSATYQDVMNRSTKEKKRYAWLDCRKWVLKYLHQYDPKLREGRGRSSQDEVSPSSGWLVLSMLKDCAPKGAKVHVFGFNWPGGQWIAHKVPEEKGEILRLAAQGGLIVHETQCQHKYHCNGDEKAPST